MTTTNRSPTRCADCWTDTSYSADPWPRNLTGHRSTSWKVSVACSLIWSSPISISAVASARRLLGDYRDNRDLISIGAYRRGSDPDVDMAIAVRDPLNEFLRQSADQLVSLKESQSQLVQLISNVATAAELARNNQAIANTQQANAAQANQTLGGPGSANSATTAPNQTAR